MEVKRGFASDNNSGVHPEIFQSLIKVNNGHVIAYGDDPYTKMAEGMFKELLGPQAETYFVFLGTGANVLSLLALTDSFNSIICAESAHIQVDECGAPEKITACKLLTVPFDNGKITLEAIKKHLHSFGFEHHAQPKVISITQATELGTLYTINEIREIADLAHRNNMFLHIDGARIANAIASMNVSLKELLIDTGVDVISFGGTKNGMMYGEAIVFLKPGLDSNFKFYRKQSMQLASKMRYISAQFIAYLENGLWLENARHSNRMANLLAHEVAKIPQIKITQKVQANGVFAIVPKEIISEIQKEYFFYVWNEQTSEVRWMTSWDTQESDIFGFINIIKKLLGTR
jgi:threonine aldolase